MDLYKSFKNIVSISKSMMKNESLDSDITKIKTGTSEKATKFQQMYPNLWNKIQKLKSSSVGGMMALSGQELVEANNCIDSVQNHRVTEDGAGIYVPHLKDVAFYQKGDIIYIKIISKNELNVKKAQKSLSSDEESETIELDDKEITSL